MPNTFNRMTFTLTFLCLLLTKQSLASDFSDAPWEFQLAPLFIWGVSIDGDASVGDNTAPLDLDFQDDVLENMDATVTVHFEAKKGVMSFFTEYQYIKLDPDVGIGPIKASIDFKNIMFEVGAGFTFSETNWTRWESLFGLRYVDQDIDVDGSFNSPLPPAEPGKSHLNAGDNWWHPFWGLRVWQRLSDRWSLVARGDFGYAASDNKASNGMAMVDFRFNRWGSVFAGYRYINFDYDNGSGNDRYAFQAAQQGPILGMNIRW